MGGEWRQVQLGELAEVRHGFAFDGQHFVDEPTADVLVTPGNFAIGGGFKLDKPKYYRGPVPPEFILQPGDLIVTMTDLSKAADTLGYGAIVPAVPQRRLLHNQRIGRVVIKRPDLVEPEFLHWVLRTTPYRNEILGSASGSTVKHTAPSRIAAYKFDLPPLLEQRTIARVLGTLDDKIELNRKMNATLETMARTLFKSWFVDFDPVRAKAEGRTPSGMDAETAKLFPSEIVESELGPIPKGWSPRAVGDLAVLSGGKQLQRELIFDTGSFPVFGGAGIMGFTAGHNADGFVISVGRVGAYCGQFFSHRGKAWINNNASLIRPNDERIAEWMFIALKHADIDVIKKGAAQPFVSNGDIANLKILWPGERTVAAFSSLLVPLINANTRNDAESTALARIRDELLPRLLSGELPVGAAERAVEEVA